MRFDVIIHCLSISPISGPSSLLSGQPGSLPSNPPRTRGMSNGTGSRPISAATLQQALSAVAGATKGAQVNKYRKSHLVHGTDDPVPYNYCCNSRGAVLEEVIQVGSTKNRYVNVTRYQSQYFDNPSLQLVQLRLMGITDETACLHALSATGGDLQAALEILYSK